MVVSDYCPMSLLHRDFGSETWGKILKDQQRQTLISEIAFEKRKKNPHSMRESLGLTGFDYPIPHLSAGVWILQLEKKRKAEKNKRFIFPKCPCRIVYMRLRFLCLIIGVLLLQKSALCVGQTAVLAFLAKKALYMLLVSDGVSDQQKNILWLLRRKLLNFFRKLRSVQWRIWSS